MLRTIDGPSTQKSIVKASHFGVKHEESLVLHNIKDKWKKNQMRM